MSAICGIQARKKKSNSGIWSCLPSYYPEPWNCLTVNTFFLDPLVKTFCTASNLQQLSLYNAEYWGKHTYFCLPWLWKGCTLNSSCHRSTRGFLTLFHLPLCLFSVRLVERKKAAVKRCEEQLLKMEVQATDREENKQIALGTSKLNYLDPRISVAWWVNTDTFDAVVKRLVPRQADAWIKADTKCEHTDKLGFQIELHGASPPWACITKQDYWVGLLILGLIWSSSDLWFSANHNNNLSNKLMQAELSESDQQPIYQIISVSGKTSEKCYYMHSIITKLKQSVSHH